jgi:hypothetical protein
MRRIRRLSVLVIWSLATVTPSGSQFSSAGAAVGTARSQRAAELNVFAGRNNEVFLGCLTCSEYDLNSVHNPLGVYGSKYSLTSIANPDSDYGSRSALESACNPYALNAPVILNGDGKYYGQLTVNKSNPQRTKIATALQFLGTVCARNRH